MTEDAFVAVQRPIFISADVGSPTLKGSAIKVEDGFDISGGGADIWGARDEFQFLYLEQDGDFDMRAQVTSLTFADLYTKAGLMARETLDEGARHVYFQIFPDNSPRNNNNGGYEYQYRDAAKGEMKAIYPATSTGEPPFPVAFPETWLRLVRVGNDFTGYFSSDGIGWRVYAAFELALPQSVLLGMAVTSHNPGALALATDRQVSLAS